jgi:DNA modification methylase
MKAFPDKFFDLAIVDPPYGIGAEQVQMGTFGNSKVWAQKQAI